VVRHVVTGGSNGGVAQLIERWASNRKVAKPWFDFRCGSASLLPSWSLVIYPSFWQKTRNRTVLY